MNELIERAAKAVWAISGRPMKASDTTPAMNIPDGEPDWERFVPEVRVVLEAVITPTSVMIDAGNTAMRGAWADRGLEAPATAGDAAVEAAWAAMIDEVLGHHVA